MIWVLIVENSGGRAILWDDKILELDDVATIVQEIHAKIMVCEANDSWLFSNMYSSTNGSSHNILWKNLKSTKENFEGNYLFGGDSNNSQYSIKKSR